MTEFFDIEDSKLENWQFTWYEGMITRYTIATSNLLLRNAYHLQIYSLRMLKIPPLSTLPPRPTETLRSTNQASMRLS